MEQDELDKRLVAAIQRLDVAAVKQILDDGANPNCIAVGVTIKSVVYDELRPNPYVAELLFEECMHYSKTGLIGVEVEPILLAMLDKGLNPNLRVRDRFPLLHMAICKGLENCVLSLLKHGADTNALDGLHYHTPLHWAANKTLSIIKALVEAGAQVNPGYDLDIIDIGLEGIPIIVNYQGIPPLNDAKDAEVIAYLRSKGARKLVWKDSATWVLE